MDFPDEAKGKRSAAFQEAQAVLHGIDIAGNFADILMQPGRSVVEFVAEKVRERGLGSLNLRRKHGFLPNIGVKEESGIGKEEGNAIETTKGRGSRVEQRA